MKNQFFTTLTPETPETLPAPQPPYLLDGFWPENSFTVMLSDSGELRQAFLLHLVNSLAVGSPIPGISSSPDPHRILWLHFDSPSDPILHSHPHVIHAPFSLRDSIFSEWSNEFENHLVDAIIDMVQQASPQILVFDSADWLFSLGCSIGMLSDFILQLSGLCCRFSLSVLFLATPPPVLSRASFSWSANRSLLLFFARAKAVFSLMPSRRRTDQFYLKSIKGGTATSDLVSIGCMSPRGIEFIAHEHEFLHTLRRPRDISRLRRIVAHKMRNAGSTYEEIAHYLAVSKVAVFRMLKVATAANN